MDAPYPPKKPYSRKCSKSRYDPRHKFTQRNVITDFIFGNGVQKFIESGENFATAWRHGSCPALPRTEYTLNTHLSESATECIFWG